MIGSVIAFVGLGIGGQACIYAFECLNSPNCLERFVYARMQARPQIAYGLRMGFNEILYSTRKNIHPSNDYHFIFAT